MKNIPISAESAKGVTRPHSEPPDIVADYYGTNNRSGVCGNRAAQYRPCAATVKGGAPCKNAAKKGIEFCCVHDPATADARAKNQAFAMERAQAASAELRKSGARRAGALKALMLPKKIETAADVIDLLHGLMCQTVAKKLDPKILAAVSSGCRTVLSALELKRKTGGSRKLTLILKPRAAKATKGESPKLTHEIERVELEITAPLQVSDPDEMVAPLLPPPAQPSVPRPAKSQSRSAVAKREYDAKRYADRAGNKAEPP